MSLKTFPLAEIQPVSPSGWLMLNSMSQSSFP